MYLKKNIFTSGTLMYFVLFFLFLDVILIISSACRVVELVVSREQSSILYMLSATCWPTLNR